MNPVASLPVVLLGATVLVTTPAMLWTRSPEVFMLTMTGAVILAVAAWAGSLVAASALLRSRPVIF
ncbi:MAG: hypothetical protein H0V12_05755 [Chloroflexi bacterium]|nr:hypothetical protein [Chloroflexota bacterium]